jgi:hypothetical protein
MLSQKDRWVGEAITGARIAYECWSALLRGEITINSESSTHLLGGGYVNLFTNYAKGQFLSAVAVLHRGFLKKEKGKPDRKTQVAYRMQKAVPVEKIDEFLRLGEPFRKFRNFDQHRENLNNPPVWTVRRDQSRPIIGTPDHGYIDPFPIYELLKSLEPAIGYIAFVKIGMEKSIQRSS